MIIHLSQSFIVHAFIALVLILLPVNVSTFSKPIEVTLNTPVTLNSASKQEKPPKNTTSSKPLKSRKAIIGYSKVKQIDYEKSVKSLLYSIGKEVMEHRFTKVYSIILLIKVNTYGRVLNVTVNKSSGNLEFDRLLKRAVESEDFPEGTPDIVLKDGIEWSFTNGGN